MKGVLRSDWVGTVLIWVGLVLVFLLPLSAAAFSPLLAWRDPIYITAGFAGIVALCLVLTQLMLIGGLVPGAQGRRGRHIHKWVGLLLVATVVLHVAGLWLTSPPDVIDALLFRSPTPFSLWGVIAMWSVFVAALMVLLRRQLPLSVRTWRRGHVGLALLTSIGAVAHTLLIQGTMESSSKLLVSMLVLLMLGKVVLAPMVKAVWLPQKH